MKLLSPFSIGSRLLPCLMIGGAAVSLEMVGCRGNRSVYRWHIDFPAGGAGAYPREFSAADLEQPGTFASDAQADQAAFGALLAFLEHAGEAYDNERSEEDMDERLFPGPVCEWANSHCDEIGMLRLEIEEGGALLLPNDD